MADSGCIFRELFGIYCPGCGGTRAVFALLRGDILSSLYYNPMVLYFIVVFGVFFGNRILAALHAPGIRRMKFPVWTLFIAIVLMTANCIIRNILKFCFGIFL